MNRNHLAATPVSLCRGVLHSDGVSFHSRDDEESTPDYHFKQKEPIRKQDTDLTEAESITSATYVLDDIPEEDYSVASDDSVFFKSDEELIRLAEKHNNKQRYVAAGRLLRRVQNRQLLTREHKEIIENGLITERVIEEHNSPRSEWTKQGEFHNIRDSIVYYRLDDQHRMVVRVEAVMEESLLVPTMALLAQAELWKTWMPSFKRPRLGVRDTWKLKDLGGNFNQIVKMELDLPWPIGNRETVVEARVTDDIDRSGACVVKIRSLTDCHDPDIEIPDNSIDYDAGMLVRQCPKDHPALSKSKHLYPHGEELLLMTATVYINPSINIVTRTFCGPLCSTLLRVAEDVRAGNHPQITKAIDDNKVLYEWVDERVKLMVH